ncbi:MAG: hypothetical protein WCO57_11305 [Verrucomicrobiota bacterium]
MQLPRTTTLATALVIGAAGFLVGRFSSPDARDPLTETQPTPTRTSSRAAASANHASSLAEQRTERQTKPRATPTQGSAGDVLKRLEAIVRGGNALTRNRALLAFIDQLATGDFEAAIAHFRSLGLTDSRSGEYAMLLTAWSQVDPITALTYAKANTQSNFATSTILSAWAATDPDAALRWADANHTGTGANPYLAGIIRTLGAIDPARATDLLASMPRSQERGEALDAMLPHLLAQGPAATRAWISALSDESLRNGSMMRAAEQLAQADPKGTADWLVANPGEAAKRRMDDVLGIWANSDKKAAVAYFEALPKGENRSEALRGVVTAIATQDAAAAATMLNRYASDVTDGTLQSFVWHSLGSDPALALSYVSRISNPGEQDRIYNRALDTWLSRDPTAAAAWMQKNRLPENVARHFQNKATGGQ